MQIRYRANGMVRQVSDRAGEYLIGRRLAERVGQTYKTRDMRASSGLDELKAEADRRGIKYHHRAGVPKLRELLEAE